MGDVMLDRVHRPAKSAPANICLQQLPDALTLPAIFHPGPDQPGIWPVGQHVGELLSEMGSAVLVKRDMIDAGKRRSGFLKAPGNRLRGKPRPVLDAPEALFFGSRQQSPVDNQRRRGIAVKSVDAQNNHATFMRSEVSVGQRFSGRAPGLTMLADCRTSSGGFSGIAGAGDV